MDKDDEYKPVAQAQKPILKLNEKFQKAERDSKK
jgi:hypothetical protein